MYLLYFCTLIPLDAPLVAFIATEESIWHVERSAESSGFENWELLDDKTLEISGATALDVDLIENKIYWINMNDKVGTICTCVLYPREKGPIGDAPYIGPTCKWGGVGG